MTDVQEVAGFLPAPGGRRLYLRELRPPEPRAELVIVPGSADHGGRYAELRRFLAGKGYAVHALDLRGHGRADGRRGHCDRFADYLDDLGVGLASLQARAEGRKLFAIGHSHGGLVVLEYLLQRGGGPLAGVVLSDPYLELAFAPPRALVLLSGLLSALVPWLPVKHSLKAEMLTRDERIQRETLADPLYNRRTTPRWFVESNRAKRDVRQRAHEIRHPLLLLLGTDDPVAAPAASRELFAHLASPDKKLIEYPGFRHEVFHELGREQAFADVAHWLAERI